MNFNDTPPLRTEIASRGIGVNGRTDGRTARKHNALRLLLQMEA